MCDCSCVPFLTTVRIMTSNTNPLDWDYSPSRIARAKPEAVHSTSLACLPLSLAVCLSSVSNNGFHNLDNVVFTLFFLQNGAKGILS